MNDKKISLTQIEIQVEGQIAALPVPPTFCTAVRRVEVQGREGEGRSSRSRGSRVGAFMTVTSRNA